MWVVIGSIFPRLLSSIWLSFVARSEWMQAHLNRDQKSKNCRQSFLPTNCSLQTTTFLANFEGLPLSFCACRMTCNRTGRGRWRRCLTLKADLVKCARTIFLSYGPNKVKLGHMCLQLEHLGLFPKVFHILVQATRKWMFCKTQILVTDLFLVLSYYLLALWRNYRRCCISILRYF